MGYERNCATCKEFEHGGEKTGKGICRLGKRDGYTFAQYVCTEWRLDAGRIGDTLHGQGIAKRAIADKGYKKSSVDAGDGDKADELRAKCDIEKHLKEKGINYGDNA